MTVVDDVLELDLVSKLPVGYEVRDTTWAEVAVGHIMQDPKQRHWLVVDERPDANGYPWLLIQGKYLKRMSVPRRPAEMPVRIVVPPHDKLVEILKGSLGAHVVTHLDERTLPFRAMRWRMEPLPRTGARAKDRIRDHIDMHHSVYVNDDWKNKKATDLWQAHEEMHELSEMTTPHHHGQEASP